MAAVPGTPAQVAPPAGVPDAKRQKILARMAKLNKKYEETLPKSVAAPAAPLRPFAESVSLFERMVGLKDNMPPVMWNEMCRRLWVDTYGEAPPADAFLQPPENNKKRPGVEEPTTEGKEAAAKPVGAATPPVGATPAQPNTGAAPAGAAPATGVAAQNAFDNVFKEAGNLLLGVDSSAAVAV